ncbi:unnamed protein product [Rhizoctonia solani]|uniref:Uncharacterized protein n=1 Tax=Rhizoctonia solani TaxID=456999 RepID=A0A8H3B0X0_9AGAM|nr:unnamed protein product [Rhizoctonia solani]
MGNHMLIEGVREIVGVTRKSKRQELVDFGKYVDKIMVNQLVSALQHNQLARQSNVREALDELHRTICAISGQIARKLERAVILVVAEEDPILGRA